VPESMKKVHSVE